MNPAPSRAGAVRPSGRVALAVLPGRWPSEPGIRAIIRHGLPRLGLQKGVASWRLRNLPNLWRGLWKLAIARAFRIPHHYGVLYLDLLHADGSRTVLGLASLRVVTNNGAGFIVDAFQNLVEAENMKFHGFGTGTNAEAASDSALQTELTTQYATDNTRPTGSQTENGAQVYRTVATLTPDADVAITEHGIFSQAAAGGGVLLDRSKFAVINLVAANPDSLQSTYDFTVNSGG
jgi:hypothetical protein